MYVKDATGRLARWALLLQQYDFEIIHRPGCQNGNADALSRRPYPTTNLNALGPVYMEKSCPGQEGHAPSRVNFTERLYEKKVDPSARAKS